MKKTIKNLISLFSGGNRKASAVPFPVLFRSFQEILATNNKMLERIADVNDKLGGNYIFDRHYIDTTCQEITDLALKLIHGLDTMAPKKYMALYNAFRRISAEIEKDLSGERPYCPFGELTLPYEAIDHDAEETVGGKNANLAELNNFLDLRIPRGFAVTGTAFYTFLGKNGLGQKIDTIRHGWISGDVPLEDAAREIRQLITTTPLPGNLEKAVNSCLAQLAPESKNKPLFLAIRSSAWGEDGELSFAGQYKTVLNVPAADFADAYRQVVASAYSENALTYRQEAGFQENSITMAVACQIMVDAVVSGVMYTLDPQGNGHTMQLGATWGLGAPLVSGQVSGDRFIIERTSTHPVKTMQIVRKENALYSLPDGGTALTQVPVDQQTRACLNKDQVKHIAETGLLIEKYFKKPQDIEFTMDRQGQLTILQTRSLNIKLEEVPKAADLAQLLSHCSILFSDKGEIAQKGIATGKVYMLSDDSALRDFPAGGILVARFASPQLARVMAKASAVLTDVGSATGHLATIAREFRVPCILNIGDATKRLHPGQEITVDAEANIIYECLVDELSYYDLTEEAIEETVEYRLLRRVLKNIAPLNLLDPKEKKFTPAACRTFHDITRFVHEKAVEELIDRNYYQHHAPNTASGKLCWKIPLDLVLIDIDGGLKPGFQKGDVTPDEILSVPLQSLLKGLAHPDVWDNEPMSVDLKSFMSSLTRTFSTEVASPKFVGQNLAVISKEYANVNLRLGYHFTVIDSYVSDNINDNYAYFRFFGGVTDQTRRSRRATFLGKVLANHDFRVELRDDLVVARIKKLNKDRMLSRLEVLGLLVGFTRQLDVKMLSEQHINKYVEKFNQLMEVSICPNNKKPVS